MKIVRTFKFRENTLSIENTLLKPYGFEIDEKPSQTEEELILNCQDADVIICAYEPITKKVTDNCTNLKLIAFKSIGFNYVDLEYATSKGIAVSHISKYCIEEVADYTVASILLANRNIIGFNYDTHERKKWDYQLYPTMRRFKTQTIGFLGFGNIPKLVAKRLENFGCQMIAFDPFVDPKIVQEEFNTKIVSLEEVLKNSDILSIHLPENEETYGIINDHNIKKLKNEVKIVNASRGGTINEKDVLKAVRENKISLYITDVVCGEYPDMETHPFLNEPNIVLTPHIAWFSTDAMDQGVEEVCKNIINFFDDHVEQANIVNR